jgi:predicted outer membrane protein
MRLFTTTLAALVAFTPAAFAQGSEVTSTTVAKIEEALAEMNCQMDPADIEPSEVGYELDDVICEGGKQFDIELDKDFNETGRRAE